MNFSIGDAPGLFFIVPLLWAAFWLYLAFRFLRAFERGVHAHERIADAMTRTPPGMAGPPPVGRAVRS